MILIGQEGAVRLDGNRNPICFECHLDTGEWVPAKVVEFGHVLASFCDAHIAEYEEMDGQPLRVIPRSQ